MNINDFVIKTMSVPFVDKGRDYSGLDCWGAVRLGFLEVYGIELPLYLDDYEDAGNTRKSRSDISGMLVKGKRIWKQVFEYRPMDVALFTLGGQPLHVGLMIDHRNFLHCEKKVGVVIEGLNRAMWRSRLEGVYRLEQVCPAK
jgi:cell wall-associated NlpC family hydrolase